MAEYLAAAALVFALNLLPAFGPPTWAVLAFIALRFPLEPIVLIVLGAAAAAAGRNVLARTARRCRHRLSARRRASLDAVEDALLTGPGRSAAGLGVFVFSPVPAGQLFVAAGLMTIPLKGPTAAFFVGRLLSYSLYVGAATAAAERLDGVGLETLLSPWGVAVQLAMLAVLFAFVRIDWARVLAGRAG